MSGKLRPRLRAVRVKLTRDLPITPDKAVVTEPDCVETTLLDSLEENVHKSGEKLRNLSLCLDGTLAGREKPFPRLSLRASQGMRPSSQRDLRFPREHSDDSMDLRPTHLSSALHRQERRTDQLFAAFQSISPVVSEIAERLRRTEKEHKQDKELILAKQTIVDLTKDVEQLNNEVNLLCEKNEKMRNAMQIIATEVEKTKLGQENRLLEMTKSCENIENRLKTIENRLITGLQLILSDLIDIEASLTAKNTTEQEIIEENERLKALFNANEEYTTREMERLEAENQSLREEIAGLSEENREMRRENEDLSGKLEGMKEREEMEQGKVRAEQRLEEEVEAGIRLNTQLKVQSSEVKQMREEIQGLRTAAQSQHERELLLYEEVHRLRSQLKDMQELCSAHEDQLLMEKSRDKTQLLSNSRKPHPPLPLPIRIQYPNHTHEDTKLRDDMESFVRSLGVSVTGTALKDLWKSLKTWISHIKPGNTGLEMSLRPVSLAATYFLFHRIRPLASHLVLSTTAPNGTVPPP